MEVKARTGAVLICNGSSAEGYESPPGAFTCTINGGFLAHRADAAFSVDCPGYLRNAWREFKGQRIISAHLPEYPWTSEPPFECRDLVVKYSSATPAALAWLASKGFRRCEVVGLDSLWGEGKPGAEYNKHTESMLWDLAARFPDGLYVRRNGEAVRVGAEDFEKRVAAWREKQLAAIRGDKAEGEADKGKVLESAPAPAPVAPPAPTKKIPGLTQTVIEIDPSPRCTRACAFCAPGIPAGRRKQEKGLSLAAHDKVLDELAAAGWQGTLCYCGHGEPALAPDLIAMLKSARAKLPGTRLCVYGNGDAWTTEMLCDFEALDLEHLVWDVYDGKSAIDVPRKIAESSFFPARVRVVDHMAGAEKYSSRCGTVRQPEAGFAERPCKMPEGKLFVTDDGKGNAAYLLCCEDYGRQSLKRGALAEVLAGWAAVRGALDAGCRGKAEKICQTCDREGFLPSGFDIYPALTATRFWPPRREPIRPRLKRSRRLVIMAVCEKWTQHAEVILRAIDRKSSMPGETMVIWNEGDGKRCPESLKGKGRILREYDYPLGWTGISRGLGEAYRWALGEGYDYIIKLDTDTAILVPGWDAAVCNAARANYPAQIGHLLDEYVWKWAQLPLGTGGGIFDKEILELQAKGKMRWANGRLKSFRHKTDHIQGGCYCFTRAGLARLEAVVGLVPEDCEKIIGEDVLFSLRSRVTGIEQIHNPAVVSHHFGAGSYHLTIARYWRDHRGGAVIHPIKPLGDLLALCEEGGKC
jgi:hypothetical protein